MPRLKNVFVLCENGVVVGAWSTLKMLCEDKQKDIVSFPSYWTLVRKTGEEIKFTEGGILYQIHILPVHGYNRISKNTEGD